MITLSISTWILDQEPIKQCPNNLKKGFDQLKAAGFDFVDANLWQLSDRGMPLSQENWREWVQGLREYADSIGVKFRQVHGQTLSGKEWDDPNYPDTEFVWQMNERCIEAAKILGADWMVMHPSNLPHDPLYSRQKAKDACLRYLEPHIELAKRVGVGIAVENMVDFGGRRRRFCGGDPEELVDLIDTINDPGVGMCIDFGHANNSGIYVPDFIRMAGSRLKCTHVNDNLGDKDTHLPPFMGTVDWRGVMSALREIGYDGDFSYEINPQRFPAEVSDVWLRFLHDLAEKILAL